MKVCRELQLPRAAQQTPGCSPVLRWCSGMLCSAVIPAQHPGQSQSSTRLGCAGRAGQGRAEPCAGCDGEHPEHCPASTPSIFLLLLGHILTHKEQTKPNFPCFLSHYGNFPCSSLVLFSLRCEHSQKQVSSSKLDELNYWKFTKGKGNKDLKHLLDFSLPPISSLFIQIIIKQAEGCN